PSGQAPAARGSFVLCVAGCCRRPAPGGPPPGKPPPHRPATPRHDDGDAACEDAAAMAPVLRPAGPCAGGAGAVVRQYDRIHADRLAGVLLLLRAGVPADDVRQVVPGPPPDVVGHPDAPRLGDRLDALRDVDGVALPPERRLDDLAQVDADPDRQGLPPRDAGAGEVALDLHGGLERLDGAVEDREEAVTAGD